MAKLCSHTNIKVAIPKHVPRPEDLLHFVESKGFTGTWDSLELDVEDDLIGLQLCLMTNPDGDEVIDGSGGLKVHRHFVHRGDKTRSFTVYYSYFLDYGVIYLISIERGRRGITFTDGELLSIRDALAAVEEELERRRTIRVRRRVDHTRGDVNG